MNSEPTTTQELADADEALGSAIGAAINARVNTPVAPPPVSLIAKQAEVQARARAVQRTVVGIAASITLLAGGVAAYNAFGSDSSTSTRATEPTVTANTTVPTDETPTTVVADEVPSTSALTWTEDDANDQFGSDLLDVYGVETAGNGRVFARAWGNSTGSQIIVSEVVGDWTRVDIPTGVSPDHVDVSGDRWLLAGQDSSQFDALARVFYSDNRGADWTEVAIDPVPEGRSSIAMALTAGQQMVIVLKIPADRTARVLQIEALIAAEGLVSGETPIEGWKLQGNTVSFWTADSSDPYSFEISDEESSVFDPSAYDEQIRSFEISESSVFDPSAYDEQIRLYSSDGGTATVAGQYVSWHTTGSSDAEGFYIAITTPNDELLLTSVDGVTWTETSIDNTDSFASGLRSATRVDEWFVGGYDGELRIKSLDQLNDPESTTATMAGMAHLISLDVGPAGMVAAAFPEGSTGTQPEPLLGWSTDGNNWEWLTPSEAFGIDENRASVNFAVGTDFVLAHVVGFAAIADSETLEAQPPRWFKATVQ